MKYRMKTHFYYHEGGDYLVVHVMFLTLREPRLGDHTFIFRNTDELEKRVTHRAEFEELHNNPYGYLLKKYKEEIVQLAEDALNSNKFRLYTLYWE